MFQSPPTSLLITINHYKSTIHPSLYRYKSYKIHVPVTTNQIQATFPLLDAGGLETAAPPRRRNRTRSGQPSRWTWGMKNPQFSSAKYEFVNWDDELPN